MFQVTVKGRNIEELKKAVSDVNNELNQGIISSSFSTKVERNLALAAESDDEMEDVTSPFVASPVETVKLSKSTVVDNELDSEGIPWDSRIHSSSKKKIANGTWRLARGTSDEQAAPIKAELRARVNASQAQTGFQPPVYQAPVQPAPQATMLVTPPQVQSVPVYQPPTVPVMQQSGHTLETFKAQFPMVLTSLINEKKINQDYINTLKNYFGVAEIWAINDEQKAELFNSFVEYRFVQKVG